MSPDPETRARAKRLFGETAALDDDQMLTFVAVLWRSAPDLERTPAVDSLLDALAVRAGVSATTSDVEVQACVQRFLDEHPLPPGFLVSFEQAVRAEAAHGTGAILSALAGFVGEQRSFERFKPGAVDPARSPLSVRLGSAKPVKVLSEPES